MPDSALVELSLVEAGDLIRTRKLSPVELVRATLERVAALNPRLNAFTTLVPDDQVLAAARSAEGEISAGRYRGPLHGIPVGVKDLIDTKGLRTTYGSGMFADYVPAVDGYLPERLRAAGAITIGKTATHEFGLGITTNNHFYGPTRNPWNLDHVPGGSSGGSGAAVAARLVPLAIGTDGGGSIRIPSAFCGIAGLKPTHGLISNRGELGSGNLSYAVSGPMTRTVRDAALATQLLAGYDPDYVYSRPGPVPDLLGELERPVKGLRVGVSPDFLSAGLTAEVRAAYEATLARLEQLGGRVHEVPMPHHALVGPGVAAVFGLEGAVHNEELFGDRPHRFSPRVEAVREQMRAVATVTACIHSQHDRQRIRRDYQVAFLEVDVLVLPAMPMPAPRIDTDEGTFINLCLAYTGAANLTGLPAMAIPAGSSGGLPIGVQIVAPAGADGLALRVAHALEGMAPEHRVQTPPLAA